MKKYLETMLIIAMAIMMIPIVYADAIGPYIPSPDDLMPHNTFLTVVPIVQCACYILVFICLIAQIHKYVKISNKLKEENNTADETKKEALLQEKKKLQRKFISNILAFIIIILFVKAFDMLFNFAKPIIYLYPEEETSVTVELGNPEILTCSYPKYIDGWHVIAKPNGDLVDTKTGRNLYALYWEGKNTTSSSKFTEGFCVKGEDSASFLEEKLAVLGLNEREAEEFIVYWLPRLERNKYNLIRFQTTEEIENNMPLNITPSPDTTIRVMMEWKGVNRYVNLPEQELVTPERTGFVVVEWGGTEL